MEQISLSTFTTRYVRDVLVTPPNFIIQIKSGTSFTELFNKTVSQERENKTEGQSLTRTLDGLKLRSSALTSKFNSVIMKYTYGLETMHRIYVIGGRDVVDLVGGVGNDVFSLEAERDNFEGGDIETAGGVSKSPKPVAPNSSKDARKVLAYVAGSPLRLGNNGIHRSHMALMKFDDQITCGGKELQEVVGNQVGSVSAGVRPCVVFFRKMKFLVVALVFFFGFSDDVQALTVKRRMNNSDTVNTELGQCKQELGQRKQELGQCEQDLGQCKDQVRLLDVVNEQLQKELEDQMEMNDVLRQENMRLLNLKATRPPLPPRLPEEETGAESDVDQEMVIVRKLIDIFPDLQEVVTDMYEHVKRAANHDHDPLRSYPPQNSKFPTLDVRGKLLDSQNSPHTQKSTDPSTHSPEDKKTDEKNADLESLVGLLRLGDNTDRQKKRRMQILSKRQKDEKSDQANLSNDDEAGIDNMPQSVLKVLEPINL